MPASDVAMTLFLLPPAALGAGVAGCCAAIAALVWLALFRFRRSPPRRVPQPAFHVAVTALFALFLSFTANEAWRRGDAAYGALLREAAELSTVAEAAGALGAPPLRAALRDYLAASLREEWGRRNVAGSEAAEAALGRVRAMALAGLGGPAAGTWRVVLDRAEGAGAARTARLVAGGLYGDALRWGGLFGLFALAILSVGLMHLELPRGAPVALGVYAAAAAIALTLAAMAEHPYAGWDATEPDRLRALLARLPAD